MTLDPADTAPESIKRSARETIYERLRQEAKWGQQNHPDGTGAQYTLKANQARDECDQAANDGTITWRHILQEEFYEALAESDEERLKQELTQVSAVANAWRESIERRQERRSTHAGIRRSEEGSRSAGSGKADDGTKDVLWEGVE